MKKRMILNAAKKVADIRTGMNAHSFLNAQNKEQANKPEEEDQNNQEMLDENQAENDTNNASMSQPAPSTRQSIRGAFRNLGSGALLRNLMSSKEGIGATQKTAEEAGKAYVKTAAKKVVTKKLMLILLPIIGVFVVITLFAAILGIFGGANSGSFGTASGGYYELQCPEMTVIKGDSVETYSATDYVAGVVAAEVGGFNNLEVYKTFAIAARTYGETHHDADCTIAGNATRQAFRDITQDQSESARLIYQAVEETDGIVMLKDGQISSYSEYDAFCYVEKNSSEYILSQKNQAIPTSWVENHVGSYYYKNCPCDANDNSKTDCWENGHWKDGGHGRGMSQYGALYLATEEQYTYDRILTYYYDDITLSTHGFMSSIAGLEIKDTTKSETLNISLSSYLSSNGSSIEQLNSFISGNVNENGYGTRAGVVTAAVSLINYLYDNGNAKIPYYWGGDYQREGVNPLFGEERDCSVSPSGNVYCFTGLDCSGFVSWAIRNGGFNISRHSTDAFYNDYGGDSCAIADSTCIGQPGDIINSKGCHAQLIISVDEASNMYYVAESTGKHGVIMRAWNMHQSNCSSSETRILHMNQLYGD